MFRVIVGLGNPEPDYAGTKHNVGRFAVQALQEQGNFSDWEKRKEHVALVSRGSLGESETVLVLPENYMNNSGGSLRKLKEEGIDQLIVVHDDIDLPLGTVRIAHNRGAGGHNGVSDIIKVLGHKNFIRVRIGIAPVTFFGNMRKPAGKNAVQRYVLSKFSRREQGKIDEAVERVVLGIETIEREGIKKAMNTYN